jgi:hypothetical protein
MTSSTYPVTVVPVPLFLTLKNGGIPYSTSPATNLPYLTMKCITGNKIWGIPQLKQELTLGTPAFLAGKIDTLHYAFPR